MRILRAASRIDVIFINTSYNNGQFFDELNQKQLQAFSRHISAFRSILF